ncbi:hypothetical protein [Flavobacterium sp.]|uniref:hypothetical protein n=1 Tax=Flavobacterium sp. TaxID=239 RepID=UPI003443B206
MKVVRDAGNELGAEASRCIKSNPRWIPGVYNGKKVNVTVTMPIEVKPAQPKK